MHKQGCHFCEEDIHVGRREPVGHLSREKAGKGEQRKCEVTSKTQDCAEEGTSARPAGVTHRTGRWRRRRP
eukprot:9184200-Prorocentrum_lima.AAC.1